eukprot:scaffold2300_cov160-Amphora_coffeaeformis.AAC.5
MARARACLFGGAFWVGRSIYNHNNGECVHAHQMNESNGQSPLESDTQRCTLTVFQLKRKISERLLLLIVYIHPYVELSKTLKSIPEG